MLNAACVPALPLESDDVELTPSGIRPIGTAARSEIEDDEPTIEYRELFGREAAEIALLELADMDRADGPGTPWGEGYAAGELDELLDGVTARPPGEPWGASSDAASAQPAAWIDGAEPLPLLRMLVSPTGKAPGRARGARLFDEPLVDGWFV
ncbi:MAG: hypothetical protein HY744_27515 [Deltaproteobacteria bacterium]|nr:hypothetical protein [Deltaproteobacteria bacterium]